jgi:zinc ribbon protein/Sel1 repeat-containing protein
LRCPRCGNDNPVTNRFCGMCGATLLQADSPGRAETAPAPAAPARPSAVPGGQVPSAPSVSAASTPTSSPSRAAAPFSDDVREQASSQVPGISGPSFLGLNNPPPATRRRGSLSIDPGSAPGSRSLDYLLEDDDEAKSGGTWKFVLFVIALALAVGFGYLRWKNQGLPPWLGLGAAKPAAAPTSDATDSNSSPAGSNTPAGASPSSAPATSPTDTAGGASTPSSAQGSTASPGAGTNPAASAAPANGRSSAPAQTVAAAPAQASPTTSNSTPSASGDTVSGSGSGTAAASPAPTAAADTAQPESAPARPAPKPRPAVAPVRVDQVAEARRYLYGQGVPQSCDRGLRLLKPLADQANSKAMVEMGALYSAGLCTPRDLPTAYRWFALALRKDPANQPLQVDLQKLWGEMTQPERQLAIKLSQ